MIRLTKQQLVDLKLEELIMDLVRKYSSYELAESLVNMYLNPPKSLEEISKISITEEQLKLFFKVKNPDEKRGRPKKEKED